MPDTPPSSRAASEFEGDYRPADSAVSGSHLDLANIRVEPADAAYLMQLADALNTTLDLETLLRRTSELVHVVIPYRLFAILLLNDHTRELRVRDVYKRQAPHWPHGTFPILNVPAFR